MKRFDVTLAGEITLDLILYGLPEDLPLERELLATNMALTLGGSSAITAHNLAALGSRVGFIPQLGADPFTGLCLERLRDAGVDFVCAVAPKSGISTGVTVLLQHEASRRALTYSGTTAGLRYQDLDLAYLSSARHFHLSSLFLQTALRDDVPKLLTELKRAGLTISLDTNDDPSDIWQSPLSETLPLVDILMPNERETCRIANEPDFEDAARKLAEIVPMLVVKRGASGALVLHEGKRYEALGIPTQIIDVLGAGDSFNAGFVHAFLQGASIESCLALGNACGAYSTTATGGTEAFANRERVKQFVS